MLCDLRIRKIFHHSCCVQHTCASTHTQITRTLSVTAPQIKACTPIAHTQPPHTHTTLTLDTTILVIGCCMCVVLFRSFQRLSRMRATSARRVRTNCKHKHRTEQLNTTPHCVCPISNGDIYIRRLLFIYD